jgi:deazaflavin-dependent oxidoreductase (nitroreductase family)
VPLLYVQHGDDVVVIGTRFGSTKHPGWYYNLRKQPRASVRVRGERYDVIARAATAEEREQIWPQAVRMYPGYDKYLDRVGSREVPNLYPRADRLASDLRVDGRNEVDQPAEVGDALGDRLASYARS